ncbi:carbon-nitrogen hydrolase family protein [Infirmifilum sp. NZ]|uniref:carbon-nitrogen hydrolase family protein n=1 Tax=Infirmifilum sp. NZ TaxID=2926850 RepID=UPI00279D0BCE|nr:carbon-nitrogen hydrolase family protein [Infirmifilum sp. NZ]UNQ73430.1 carbon-nitrogen hydrolase family protein [Infirmifilum sp. NZ]
MKVALHQMVAGPNKEENLRRVLEKLSRADADLHVFPEYLMGVGEGGVSREHVHALAEPLEGPFAASVVEKSGELGTAVAFSAFLREGDGVYNAAVLADRGRVVTVYRKVHLFDAFGYRESSVFAPGDSLAVARLGDFTVGLAVCFDLRFPELFRAMALRGAELFIVPSAWYRGPYKVEQWLALTAARAHENTAYLIAVDQTGSLFAGHSTIVTPLGHRLVDLGEREGVIVVEINRGEVEEARRLVPVLQLLRRDLYVRWYGDSGA